MQKSILMVCLGNICRSPMAEGVLRHKAELMGLNVTVDSAGTAGYHIGESPDPRAIEKMKEKGIDISMLRARQFEKADFEVFDSIFVMDQSNLSDVVHQATNSEQTQKVSLVLNSAFPNENRPVPDPYYGDDSGFEQVYQLLDTACDEILKTL